MELVLALLVIGALVLAVAIGTVKNVLYVCEPNEVLIFSGRPRDADGRKVGYRIIKGGRTLRMPLIETVDRMDLTNLAIEVSVRGAYSKGGIPLSVQGVANVKIPGEEPLIHNALERFLGMSRAQIAEIARETLEGNLRGVLATLTPEQINQDKEAFAIKLTEEAEHDLNRIGIVLDTLKIQNVTDDVGYLSAIGRMRSADVRRNAHVAEAEASAQAAHVKWDNAMQGEMSKLESEVAVARKQNDRRIADARTKREAMIAEELAVVQAAIAQARAEAGMQTARIEQVKLRLQADVVQPAEAQKREAIANAKAGAARIIEQGKATATVLNSLANAYRTTQGSGRDVLLMQKLVPLLRMVSGTIGELHVDRLTVVGATNGQHGGGGSIAGFLVNANEQVKAATGIDVARAMREKTGQESAPNESGPEYVGLSSGPVS